MLLFIYCLLHFVYTWICISQEALYLNWLFLHIVTVDNPKIRGLAAPSTLTMNQELEGHKGTTSL